MIGSAWYSRRKCSPFYTPQAEAASTYPRTSGINKRLLICEKDVGTILSNAHEKSDDSDAICLARAGQIVRRDIFAQLFTFEGSNCQEKSVSTTLITLINMLLEGPNIAKQADRPVQSEALTIAQLIRHNSVKHQ